MQEWLEKRSFVLFLSERSERYQIHGVKGKQRGGEARGLRVTCHRFPEAKLAEPSLLKDGPNFRFDSVEVARPLKSGSASFAWKSGDKSPQSCASKRHNPAGWETRHY